MQFTPHAMRWQVRAAVPRWRWLASRSSPRTWPARARGGGGIVLRKALDVDSVWDALEKEGLRGGLLKWWPFIDQTSLRPKGWGMLLRRRGLRGGSLEVMAHSVIDQNLIKLSWHQHVEFPLQLRHQLERRACCGLVRAKRPNKTEIAGGMQDVHAWARAHSPTHTHACVHRICSMRAHARMHICVHVQLYQQVYIYARRTPHRWRLQSRRAHAEKPLAPAASVEGVGSRGGEGYGRSVWGV